MILRGLITRRGRRTDKAEVRVEFNLRQAKSSQIKGKRAYLHCTGACCTSTIRILERLLLRLVCSSPGSECETTSAGIRTCVLDLQHKGGSQPITSRLDESAFEFRTLYMSWHKTSRKVSLCSLNYFILGYYFSRNFKQPLPSLMRIPPRIQRS